MHIDLSLFASVSMCDVAFAIFTAGQSNRRAALARAISRAGGHDVLVSRPGALLDEAVAAGPPECSFRPVFRERYADRKASACLVFA
jgi:hypothetical protein